LQFGTWTDPSFQQHYRFRPMTSGSRSGWGLTSTPVYITIMPYLWGMQIPVTERLDPLNKCCDYLMCEKLLSLSGGLHSQSIAKCTILCRFSAIVTVSDLLHSDKNKMYFTNFLHCSIIGPTGCTICFQFITINSLYMFRSLIFTSSGGTVYTTVGIFSVYYVGWLQPNTQISAQNM
jgi:hypothetical protein